MAEQKLYSARECAKELGVSELTVHRLLRAVNAPKVMNVFAVPKAFLDKLKKERAGAAKRSAA